MTLLKRTSVTTFLFVVFSLTASGQVPQPRSASDSCREFVTIFYSWYVETASRAPFNRDGAVALKYRSFEFSPAIVLALREDNKAQDKAGSDLVSLDGDPFVGADGLAERYIVDRVTVKDGRCWAEIHAVWDGKEDESPDVTPEMAIKNSRWLFVNFFFPSPSDPKAFDLLSTLKNLRDGRQQATKRTSER